MGTWHTSMMQSNRYDAVKLAVPLREKKGYVANQSLSAFSMELFWRARCAAVFAAALCLDDLRQTRDQHHHVTVHARDRDDYLLF